MFSVKSSINNMINLNETVTRQNHWAVLLYLSAHAHHVSLMHSGNC